MTLIARFAACVLLALPMPLWAQDEEPLPAAAPLPAARVIEVPQQTFEVADEETGETTRVENPVPLKPLGFLPGSGRAYLLFNRYGAGLEMLSLPDSYRSVKHESLISLQSVTEVGGIRAIPFAALAATVNGQTVDLASQPVWREVEAGVFECFIDDPDGSPLLKITRTFRLKPDDQYGFTLTNTVENLSARAVTVSLSQTGPIDLPKPENSYGGDHRRVRFGYLLPVERQSSDTTVLVDDDLKSRKSILGSKVESGAGKVYPAVNPVWPNEQAAENGHRLSWLAMTDRYFAVAAHPVFDPGSVAQPEDKLFDGAASIDRLILNPASAQPDTIMVLRLNGEQLALAPGETASTELGVYAGPMSRPSMRRDPLLVSLRVPEMVVYSMGGICAPCTFQWLTGGLMSVLRLFHSFTGDWAVAIMLLVVLVRGCLHPVTRWSQIRMQKFGVQMQA
ncbi:MAG: YidC/Oxa1 family insertase periplasmic-domain containing protein, partial [Planctomycetota bacterium]